MWLGVQAIRHRERLASTLDATETVRQKRSVVLDGFVVGIANPNAIVFFATVLPQFVDRDGATAGLQMAFLGAVFVVVALISDGA